jgi:outer membrane protein assembly factor BamB
LELVSSILAAAQVAMPDGNPQRSRVFVTRSLDAPPQLLLWRLEKLFRLRFSEEVTGQNGPFTIRGSIPTFQHFTTPIVSDGVIFFKVYMIDSYLFAVDAATGKQIVTLKFDKKRAVYAGCRRYDGVLWHVHRQSLRLRRDDT